MKQETKFEREVLDRLTKIETKLDDYNGIKSKAEDGYVLSKENEKDIQEIQDKLKWVTRTLVSAIITGIITLLVAYLKFVIKI